MGKSKAVKQDNIEQLRNELECLKDELENNARGEDSND